MSVRRSVRLLITLSLFGLLGATYGRVSGPVLFASDFVIAVFFILRDVSYVIVYDFPMVQVGKIYQVQSALANKCCNWGLKDSKVSLYLI